MKEYIGKLGEYLTTAEVAKHYGVTRQAVHLWRKEKAPHIQLGAQTILYNIEELDVWLKINRSHFNGVGARV